jgi:arsenate reductase (glutaredoxin)
MRKIWYLKSCDTCQRIVKELGGLTDFEHQNIKEENISAKDLEWLKKKAGSYEALFSRRAMKFREWGLHEKTLTEKDYRDLILKEYTFLKRPVIVIGEEVFVGNAKKEVEAVKRVLKG